MNNISYFQTELTPHFPPLPYNGALSCKHLPMAIIQGLPEEKVGALIYNCSKTARQKFSQVKDITILHLAALFGRDQTVTELCSNAKNVLPKDAEGNTPLHFRAISTERPFDSDPFYQNYFTKCSLNSVNRMGKNKAGASADDLFKMRQLLKTPPFSEVFPFLSHHFEDTNRDQYSIDLSSHISIEKGCLDPDVHFVDQVVARSEALFDQWLYGEGGSPSTMEKRPLKMTRYKFAIQQIPGKGCGLVAREDIPKGEILFPYVGELVSQQPGHHKKSENGSDYLFNTQETKGRIFKIDAYTFRGVAAYINDSVLPNIFASPAKNEGGMKNAIYFISNGIKRGEELSLDYSESHPVKYSPSYFLSEAEFNKLRALIEKGKPPFETVLDPSENPVSKIYLSILRTPLVFFKLIAAGSILPTHLAKILLNPEQNENQFEFFALEMAIGYYMAKSKEIMQSQENGFSHFEEVISYFDRLEERLIYKPQSSINERRLIFFFLFFDGFYKLYEDLQNGLPLEKAVENFNLNFKMIDPQFDLHEKLEELSKKLTEAFRKAVPGMVEDFNKK